MKHTFYSVFISLIVALGGFLLGFDSAVISGALPFYGKIFGLDQGSLLFGLSVSAITIGAIVGNIFAGPLADRFGRKSILLITAFLFGFCALGTAFSHHILFFIIARLIGGLGVGMAILIAPMFIAEIAPRKLRGMLVSINQLNIVLGISVAFFTNYFILNKITDVNLNWRWMLGIGTIPATIYFLLLFFIPQSPRWLAQRNRDAEAKKVLGKIGGESYAENEYREIQEHLAKTVNHERASFGELFVKNMRTILIIGLGLAFFQQITGINSALYYSTMIFNLTGIGNNAAFTQAIIIGLTNFVFTVISMFLIDRLGRKPLLVIGGLGIACSLLLVAIVFSQASYSISDKSIEAVSKSLTKQDVRQEQIKDITTGLTSLKGKVYNSEVYFFRDVKEKIGHSNYINYRNDILQESIAIKSVLVLIGLMIFVASFAISFGPVMWAMLSEIFPNRLRGVGISLMGFFNSIISTATITLFPVSLRSFGISGTYMFFAAFGFLSVLFVLKYVPETKGKSLEELEDALIINH